MLAAALQATGSAVEAGRERDLARQLSSRYEELARPAPPTDRRCRAASSASSSIPTDPGSLHADQAIVGTSAQREQRELAAFHLERGRRLFEREQDREAMAELRRAVYLSPYEAQAHLLIGRILPARRPPARTRSTR